MNAKRDIESSTSPRIFVFLREIAQAFFQGFAAHCTLIGLATDDYPWNTKKGLMLPSDRCAGFGFPLSGLLNSKFDRESGSTNFRM